MPSRKPKRDDAPQCKGKDCHSATMDIIFKQGGQWYFKCPKCGYITGSCHVKEVSPAMKEFMKRPPKEAPK
jgi:tRNA(Ile2) C34 agmatinyltransferase TiaS